MTDSASGVGLGSWMALGPRDSGTFEYEVPTGFDAYAEVIHERLRTPEAPGALSQAKLHVLVGLLGAHTSTPDVCFFGQWTVWGYQIRPTRIWTFADGAAHAHNPQPRPEYADLHPLDGRLDLATNYTYQLFSGPLAAAQMVGHWFDENTFEAHAPDLIWPEDRAWCVRRDGDSDTIIAGSQTLIHDVLAHPELDPQLI